MGALSGGLGSDSPAGRGRMLRGSWGSTGRRRLRRWRWPRIGHRSTRVRRWRPHLRRSSRWCVSCRRRRRTCDHGDRRASRLDRVGQVQAVLQVVQNPARAPPRMHPAELQDPGLDLARHLVRARRRPARPRRQPRQTLIPVTPQLGMHAPPPLIGNLAHRPALGQHREHCPVLLLLHAQLLQHESSVKKHPKPPSASTGAM